MRRTSGESRLRAFVIIVVATAVLAIASPRQAAAQGRFDVGAQVVSATSDQFDESETGFGGRVAWYPVSLVGVEAEVNVFPSAFPDQRAFSGRRIEGLFGVTAGPRLGFVRPFVKFRPGFLNMSEAPQPFACIAIFPPPLACSLAAGQTLAAFDLGGGLEVLVTPRGFVRVDVSDRMVRYRGPVFDGQQQVQDDTFYGHDVRVAVGAGIRF
jgi:hypothetical protein